MNNQKLKTKLLVENLSRRLMRAWSGSREVVSNMESRACMGMSQDPVNWICEAKWVKQLFCRVLISLTLFFRYLILGK